MKPSDDIQIEPLSETAWNRIELAVFDELDTRIPAPRRAARERTVRWPTVALSAFVAIPVAAAAVFLMTRPDQRDELDSARFVTGKEASETLLGDVSIGLEPESALVVVKNAAAGSLVILERGVARFSVPPRETRPAFVVQAGDVRVDVVGTRFLVERVGGSARVQGYEGKVRVIARGQSTLVQRGESWPPSAAIAPPSAAPSSPASPGAPLAPSELTEPSAAERRTAAQHGKSRGRSAAANLGEQFERAALLEASAPNEALRVYRSLAAQGGRWGANALYAMARLETERGRRASAERLSRAYLARYPNGANASDARALIERLSREP
jgi:hypothetical protein